MISNSRKVDDLKSDFLGKFKTTFTNDGDWIYSNHSDFYRLHF